MLLGPTSVDNFKQIMILTLAISINYFEKQLIVIYLWAN